MLPATSLPMKNHSLTAPGDREQDDQERQAVTALILLEGLGPERAEQPAGAMRQTHPGADDDRRLVGLADVALRCRAGLAGTGRWRDDDAFAGARPLLVGLVLLAMPPRYVDGAGHRPQRRGARHPSSRLWSALERPPSAQALDHRVAPDAALRDREALAAVERRGEVAALDAEAQARVAIRAALLARAPAGAFARRRAPARSDAPR